MVKILLSIPGTKKLQEIGALEFQQKLPNGTKTKCNHCGKRIDDVEFIFGYQHGIPNMAFHENCLNQGELFNNKKKSKKSPVAKKTAKKKGKVNVSIKNKKTSEDSGAGPGK